MKILPGPLHTLISQIFASAGCGEEEANCVSEHLVKANLCGHDSHWVIRAPIYVEWMEAKRVFPDRTVQVVSETDTTAVLDGQMGLGQWVGQQAIQLGVKKADRYGVAVVGLRNVGHLGRIGHWSEQASDAGMVGLNFVNTSGLGMHVVPAGGLDKRLSVNPVSIGAPASDQPPIVLDIAAAATAEGKLKVARNQGVPVPDGWIVNSDGEPTTDPNDFYNAPGGAILPLGGHKGYGLGFMAELLAGALTGSGCSQSGKTVLEQGMLSIIINPQVMNGNEFPTEVQRYAEFVRSSRPIDPNNPVLAPGDIELRNQQERGRDGIELDDNTLKQIIDTARKVQVAEQVIEGVST